MKLINISKNYGDKKVLQNINLSFDKNECVAIVGQSGIGKTTLLNIIAGLVSYQGEIYGNERISYMMQEDVFIENLSVLDNLRLFTKKSKNNILEFLSALNLQNIANEFPDKLSGGMRRRISFLRALHFDADILLLDEPFKSLDMETKAQCVKYLKSFLQTNPRLCIVVTHDPIELAPLHPRIVNM